METMDKQQRLERMKRRMKAWEASIICSELIKELADGMERAVPCNMVGALVEELVDTAGAARSMSILVQEIM